MNIPAFAASLARTLAFLLVSASAFAQDAQTISNETEKLIRSGEEVKALGSDLFGDKVNLYTGGLEFVQTDVSLPGNNALPVSVGRWYTPGNQSSLLGAFGDWELEIPHLQGIFAKDSTSGSNGWNSGGGGRCSAYGPPSGAYYQGTNWNAGEFWFGNFVHIPGLGTEEILSRDPRNANAPTDGNTWPLTTRSLWAIRCLPSTAAGGGEGFLVVTPDGTQYRFDWLVSRSYIELSKSGPGAGVDAVSSPASAANNSTNATGPITNLENGYNLHRQEVWIMPTLVTDRFGNTVTYNYDGGNPWRVTSIVASDGRSISINYDGASDRITSVFDGTRTWTYTYATNPNGAAWLTNVTQPDNSAWTFSLTAFSPGSPMYGGDALCETTGASGSDPDTGTMTHPSGATGSFTIQGVVHGRSFVRRVCTGDGNNPDSQYAYFPKYSTTKALVSKTLSGPGLPAETWNYSYSNAEDTASWSDCSGSCLDYLTVDVTDPRNVLTRYTFGTRFEVTEGQLQKVEVGTAGVGFFKTTSSSYRSPDAGPYSPYIGDSKQRRGNGELASRFAPQNQKVVNQQGVDFTWQADPNGFDGMARAQTVSRYNSLGYGIAETTAFADHFGKWVLGQKASVTELSTGRISVANTFDPDTANVTSTRHFGHLDASFTYYGGGTLQTRADGAGHTTTFSNYKRGLAQSATYADGNAESAEVNDIGLITSVTDANGFQTTYGYDAIGRLSSINRPTGDSVAWNATTLTFEAVGGNEYDLGAGHWRQTVATGNARTVIYFDALWRPRVTRTFDAADPGGTAKTVLRNFDADNRKVYESYPVRDVASINSPPAGTSSIFDSLGRPTTTYADSELGTLTTSNIYLANFQKQTVNARNYATTMAYQAFDEPDESRLVAASMPEGVSLQINRDVFGKALAITRSGPAVASGLAATTKYYTYDGYQRLCKTLEAEVGATVQDYDDANNVAWRATGLGLGDPGTCNTGDVPGGAKVSYGYDGRNRLTFTGYGDGSASIGRSYTPDGQASTVASGNSIWSYAYNKRRLLTQETLTLDGANYTINHGYDANGHMSALGYPDGTYLAYAPNALGEATQVGGYAGGIGYHPSGAVASYTLANGVVHSRSETVRNLPLVNADSGVMSDRYDYDPNGNIAAITDQQEGVSSRGMGYDGLDRLVAANSPGVWGNGSYSYDGLDNLRTSLVGGRSSTHDYDTANRLSTINTNGVYTGYAYDARANITARGANGYYFDQANRMQLANGIASYAYDGWGRRTGVTGLDGTSPNRVQVYAQSGELLYGTQQGGQGATSSATAYIYLAGKTVAETSTDTGTTWLYTDALGSPVAYSGTVNATVTYTCPASWTLAGNTCVESSGNTVAASVSGYNCPSGYTLAGNTCSQTATSTGAATVTYGCPSGWTLSGSTCTTGSSYPATPAYSCPDGYTLSGSTCTGPSSYGASQGYDCHGQGSLQANASSSSGYSCVVQTIMASDYEDPYAGCQDVAASIGLPLVATRLRNNGKLMDCTMGPVIVYTCPSGGSLSGSTCNTTSSQAASVSSYTCPSGGSLSGSDCITASSQAATPSYSCPSGQTLSGTSCSQTTTYTTAGTPIYSCPGGYTLSGSSCIAQGSNTVAATADLTCPNGGSLSGTHCTGGLFRTRYEAYGKTAAGVEPNDIGFTGHVNDANTGLVYMQQRYYDPLAGRFQSVDPVVTDANTGKGFGLYHYAQNNPYRYVDPDGRDARDDQIQRDLDKAHDDLCGGGGSCETVVSSARNSGAAMSPSGAANAPPLHGPGRPLTEKDLDHLIDAVMIIGLFVPGVDLFDAELIAIRTASSAAKGTTTLYRAVSAAEHADIAAIGGLRAGPNSFAEGKWFWESAEHAAQFGTKMDGSGKFQIIEATFPRSTADRFMRLDRLDGIGPARFGTFEQLSNPLLRTWP